MKLNKTDKEALAFAETLLDQGEHAIFSEAWDTGNHTLIQGHFPAFGLEVTAEKSATTKKEVN